MSMRDLTRSGSENILKFICDDGISVKVTKKKKKSLDCTFEYENFMIYKIYLKEAIKKLVVVINSDYLKLIAGQVV